MMFCRCRLIRRELVKPCRSFVSRQTGNRDAGFINARDMAMFLIRRLAGNPQRFVR